MPLPGGATDKFGNRYEGRWTVACMIDVMDERADSIRLEPPGKEGEGVEFWFKTKDICEYHQVKRQLGANGRWTIADLKSKNILSHFWGKLSEPTAHCIFVSSHAAFQLDELADRARRAASWQEFNQEFLNTGQSQLSEQLKNFQQLCINWNNCSEIDAYDALKRIKVRTVDEETLLTIVESRLAALVEGNAANVADILAQYALDQVHKQLIAHDIWHYLLSERGYRRREWGKDPHVLAAVDKVNERYLDRLQKEAIAGKIIPRDEVDIILDNLTAPSSKCGVLVVGEAGVGKSGVILQTVDVLHKKGVPIIAFRVDRLNPTNSPEQVGGQLELPGSPAHVLANIAQGRDCVLIIDQLDAVSTASGRNPQFFECVEQIIEQAKAFPRMRLLLACRKFDLDYDYRLKRLTGENGIAETVTISRLSHEKVREVVAEQGLDSTLLNPKQLELLSVPLHLKLLAEVAEFSGFNALNFRTAKDLYDKFWNKKKDVIYERVGNSEHWTNVIYTLCDYMSKNQRLSAPKARVDRYGKTAELMTSEHVLILDGQQYSFFHESFFDYAFARRFAGEDEELLNFLGSKEQQHLFRRAQVRQILLYERDAERDRYLTDLQALLTSPVVRFHMKKVVLAVLAIIDNPTEEEWEIIAPLMGDKSDPISQQVWKIFLFSFSWFQLLDSLGLIEQWLRDENEEHIEQALTLLSFMQRQKPDRIAELLEPFIGVSEAWNSRLSSFIEGAELSASRRFFELFLQLIDEGIVDDVKSFRAVSRDFWRLIYELPKQHPEWACEVISHYLNRHLNLSLAAEQPNPFDDETGTIVNSTYSYYQVFMESASAAPQAFITQVLPFIIRVLELTAQQENDPLFSDLVWTYRYKYEYGNIEDALLEAMAVALHALVINKSDTLINFLEKLKSLNFKTAQYLVICIYTADGERFADEATEYLCEQPARLRVSYDRHPHWTARHLIEAITPHCSNERLAGLERVILNYYPGWEMGGGIRYGYQGHAQFILLDGITSSRRSETASLRLEQWRRKFGEKPIEGSKRVTIASIVAPPISVSATEKMTNEQWLKAIAKYSLEKEHRGHDGRLTNAEAMPDLLESQVKIDPDRFAQLVWEFPDNTHQYYFDAVLRGLATVEIDVQTALYVCQRCHQLPLRPCGRWIGWLIGKLSELPWTEEALDILVWYALEDSDPEQELWRTNTSSGQVDYNRDILNAGINSTRGSAVEAIAKLIFADKNRASYFQQPLQQIVQDSSIAVRSCAAEALTAMLNYDRDLSVSLFQQLCNTEEALLGTQTIEYFLYYALPTHFHELASIVERMIMSEQPEVVKVGARQACLTSLIIEEARWLAEVCLSGTEAHRIAAAEIFVANFHQAHFREFCENALVQLFNDSSQEVRSQAARCFLHFQGEQIGDYLCLVNAFIDSPAFSTDDYNLIHALEETTAKLPDAVTYRVCDRFLENLKSDDANVRQGGRFRADKVSKLLVQLYSQSKDQKLQSCCLDLIDLMTQMEVYKLADALIQYER